MQCVIFLLLTATTVVVGVKRQENVVEEVAVSRTELRYAAGERQKELW